MFVYSENIFKFLLHLFQLVYIALNQLSFPFDIDCLINYVWIDKPTVEMELIGTNLLLNRFSEEVLINRIK